jgi:hypothetical protein
MNAKSRPRLLPFPTISQAAGAVVPERTLDQRIAIIKALGERINLYVQFMCKSAQLQGVSPEVHESTVIAFHERLVVVEKQLARLHDACQLE